MRGPQKLALASLLLSSAAASAGFDANERSINGTGETLAQGRYEVGIGSVAYGVTNQTMVRVPTLSILVGAARLEARHKVELGASARATPYVGAETPRHGVAGVDFGLDLGTGREHSLTVGAGAKIGPHGGGDVSAEYDFYHRGNVVYAGVVGRVGYLGYTWAWESFHVGLITSPASGFLPFPYVAWRL